MKKLIFILLSFLLLGACQKKAEKLIPKQTYKQILKEIILANLIQEKYQQTDSAGNNILTLVYKKYNIDSLSLKKTTDYYSKHPGELAEIYTEIHLEFKQKADSLNKLVPNNKSEKDEVKVKKDLLHSKKLFKNIKQTLINK